MRDMKFRYWSKDNLMYYSDADYQSLEEFFSYQKTWKSLMQFTGLKDKNGKDIYEGDIVKYFGPTTEQIGENQIIYEEDFARFGLYFKIKKPSKDGADAMSCAIDPDDNLEVIGNIWEVDNLLK